MSYPAYPEYKDSGLEHIGQIPSHWEITKLPWLVYADNAGEVIDKTYWGSGCERLYTCARKPMRSDFIGFPEKKRTARNDLLLTRNGTPYIHEPVPGAIYSNVVQRISLVPRVNRKFLRHGLDVSSKSLVGYGVSIASFNYEMWCSLRLVLPDKEEQNKIVVFLNHETARIDALVEEQQRLIALLKEKRQAVISHAVTKGLDPDVPMKDSGVEWLGEVPEHWEVRKASYIGRLFGSDNVPDDMISDEGDTPYLKVGSLSTDSLEVADWGWYLDPSISGAYRACDHYVVFPKRGAAIFLNKVNVVSVPALIDPNLMGWEIEGNHSAWYFAYSLKLRKLDELEPPRLYRRLHILRGWSYELTKTIFPRSPGASCSISP